MKVTSRVLIVLLCFFLLGCSLINQAANDTSNEGLTIETNNSDPLIVAQKLMVNYLDHLKSDDIEESQRIKAYLINDVKIYSQNTSGFVFTANYSVQYVEEFAGSGNGTIAKDGWVLNKYQFFNVGHNKETYTIKDIATSPY